MVALVFELIEAFLEVVGLRLKAACETAFFVALCDVFGRRAAGEQCGQNRKKNKSGHGADIAMNFGRGLGANFL